ncbi:MAG: DUF3500 domain-containing protein [Rhodothermales bacterium]
MQYKLLAGMICVSILILLGIYKPAGHETDRDAKTALLAVDNSKMIEAAQHFLSLTNAEEKQVLVYPFESEERTFWNFVPMTGERKGLVLRDMSTDQKMALHALLQSTLSTKGYLKTTGIQQLERILGVLEDRPVYRDPTSYYLTIFGTPAADTAWGWRFEGHHLSLNFSSVNNELAIAPAFMGSNPSKVLEGTFAGLRVLSEEIDVARTLMASLSPEQQATAIISDTSPREIITGNERKAVLESYEGLKYTDMKPHQQMLLKSLINVYAGNLRADVAQAELDRIEAAGYDKLYFAWAGSLIPDAGHYYRIHGTTLLIEYDNTQTEANHIHTVWRDLTNDFGRDLLHKHYEDSENGHGH